MNPPLTRSLKIITVVLLVCRVGLLASTTGRAAPPRPMIWATDADRAPILDKIKEQPWAKTVFDALKARVADSVAAHARDPDKFLRGLPFVPHPTDPARHPTFALIGGKAG